MNPVVFYDGDCGFCNKSVQFILRNERKSAIFFSAIQSNYTKALFENNHWPRPDLSTFYFLKDEVLYSKSTAALKVIPYLRWYYQILRIGWVIPALLRDKLYDFVAKRRTKLAKGFCVLPSTNERQRFLS